MVWWLVGAAHLPLPMREAGLEVATPQGHLHPMSEAGQVAGTQAVLVAGLQAEGLPMREAELEVGTPQGHHHPML